MRKIEFKKKSNHSLIKRFTLIEILVVVAIIGILASLLMPSLSKARKKARNVHCLNNLKQLGTAIYTYTVDSDGHFPGNTINPGRRTWDDQLAGYDGRETLSEAVKNGNGFLNASYGEDYGQVYRCPLEKTGRWGAVAGRTYIANYDTNRAGELGIHNNNDGISKNLSHLSKSAETIILIEYNHSSNRLGKKYLSARSAAHLWSNKNSNPMLHDGDFKQNYLMGDGHVAGLGFWNTLVPYGATTGSVRNSLWDATK